MQPPEVWDGGVGFVTKEMIQSHCPSPASDIQVYIVLQTFICDNAMQGLNFHDLTWQILRCGPPPMNKAMAANLEALGYTSEMQFQF